MPHASIKQLGITDSPLWIHSLFLCSARYWQESVHYNHFERIMAVGQFREYLFTINVFLLLVMSFPGDNNSLITALTVYLVYIRQEVIVAGLCAQRRNMSTPSSLTTRPAARSLIFHSFFLLGDQWTGLNTVFSRRFPICNLKKEGYTDNNGL